MEKTVSFHSQVHKINFPPQPGPHRHNYRERLHEQLFLPAMMWRGWRWFAGHQGQTPILSCAVISWTLTPRRVHKRFKNHWGQSGCSTWASVETSLAMLFAAFLLQWLTVSPWWWTRVHSYQTGWEARGHLWSIPKLVKIPALLAPPDRTLQHTLGRRDLMTPEMCIS